MKKVIAIALSLVGAVLLGVGIWGLVYLPGKMESAAESAIDDFKTVLARNDTALRLTRGAITADPFTATVTVADVALENTRGGTLRTATLIFGIDPFTREISSVEARRLDYRNTDGDIEIGSLGAHGLTEGNRKILALAAKGALTPEILIENLTASRMEVKDIRGKHNDRAEFHLDSLGITGVKRGKIDSAFIGQVRSSGKTGQGRESFSLGGVELKDLNIAEVYRLIKKGEVPPHVEAPILTEMSIDGAEISSPRAYVSFARIAAGTNYVENGRGGLYANKSWFTIKDLSARPGEADQMSNAMLEMLGVKQLRMNMEVSGRSDHKSRRVAFDKFSIRIERLANFDMTLSMGAVPDGLFVVGIRPEDLMPMMAEMKTMTLENATLTLKDMGLVQVLMKRNTEMQGIDRKTATAQIMAPARAQASLMNMPFLMPLIDEIEKFINKPGTLRISLAPAKPLSVSTMESLAATAPDRLHEALGLTVKAGN